MDLCNLFHGISSSILDHKLFQMILKNDFVIYGSILTNILSGKKTLEDYRDNHVFNNSISIYGKFSYREILERDIREFIIKPILLGNELYSKTVLVSYTLLIDDIEFILDVLYIKNDVIDSCINFYNELLITVTLDKLILNRKGLNVIDNKIGTPNPFLEILREIKNKEFRVIVKLNPFTKKQCKYLKYLRKLGYKNKDSIIRPYYKKDKKCNICYDTEYRQFSILECNHVFHKKCLEKAIDESLKESHTFNCPYCNKKYLNFEVL